MRNESVERAVRLVVSLVDEIAGGMQIGDPPSAATRKLFDDHVSEYAGSVRLACVFFAAYAVVEPDWDFKSVPTGVRGKYGDKLLAGELTFRNVTFHNSVTAFGENLGWKGAVRQFDLSTDPRFAAFVGGLSALGVEQRKLLLKYIAWRLHSSRVVHQALPPLPRNFLSYARSLDLCERLLALPSEGHIQQFLVAAFLDVHRRRYGHRITTHHPHASDKFDRTVGDIEEHRDGALVAAYEVTVRDDWKNRLADFGKKVAEGRLAKYIIFASGVRNDSVLRPAGKLIDFVERLPFDLAVVDLLDFFSVFCAELERDEIHQAINRAYEFLVDPRLSGRHDFVLKYRQTTDLWLDD